MSQTLQTFFYLLFYDPVLFLQVICQKFANYLVVPDEFANLRTVFFPYFLSWVSLSLILNLNSVTEQQFKAAFHLLLLDKNRGKKEKIFLF